MTKAHTKLLSGRRIVRFEANPFDDGRGGTANDPVIYLDNGATLTFTVQETEMGEYGVVCNYHAANKKGE